MARSALNDPLTKFRWSVNIPGFSRLGFTTCSTPSLNVITKDYAEGGQHWAPKKIADRFEYTPITLTRGATNDTSFNKWATGIVDLYTNGKPVEDDSPTDLFGFKKETAMSAVPSGINGKIEKPGSDEQPPKAINPQYRRDIRIDHINRAGQVEVSYFIYGAFPISYKPGSDFDAMGDDSVSVESITLGYDSFETKYSGIAGFVGNIAAGLI